MKLYLHSIYTAQSSLHFNDLLIFFFSDKITTTRILLLRGCQNCRNLFRNQRNPKYSSLQRWQFLQIWRRHRGNWKNSTRFERWKVRKFSEKFHRKFATLDSSWTISQICQSDSRSISTFDVDQKTFSYGCFRRKQVRWIDSRHGKFQVDDPYGHGEPFGSVSTAFPIWMDWVTWYCK